MNLWCWNVVDRLLHATTVLGRLLDEEGDSLPKVEFDHILRLLLALSHGSGPGSRRSECVGTGRGNALAERVRKG